MTPAEAPLVVLVLIIMLVGLAGTIVPVLPGLLLTWAGALLYGLLAGFHGWGVWIFAAITLLTLIGYGAGLLMTHLGAAKTGASWQGLLAALVLGIIGFFVIPILGALVGAVVGLFLVEYYRRKDVREAWRTTSGAIIGYGLSLGLQIALGVSMIALWGLWVWLE